jgi:acyl-CoA thioester hydrolase
MNFEYPVLIRESHLDTFGHVNNATYLALYEEARWDLVTKNGYGLKEVHRLGQGPIILEANIKFMAELRLREKIRITCEMIEYKGKIGKLKQQMLKDDGKVASELIMVFGLFDLKERKLIEPTDAWKKALGLPG